MQKKTEKFNRGEIVIYKSLKNEVELKVRLEGETVWLDARQMARIFGVNRPAVVKHINNIYKTGELSKKITCSILEQLVIDGKNCSIITKYINKILKGKEVNKKSNVHFLNIPSLNNEFFKNC